MSLNKSQLKQEIAAIMEDMKNREEDAIDEFSTRMADAIDQYVKGIQINYTTGLANQGGPVTGVLQHTVS